MKQAYGSEPILFSSSPITPASKPAVTAKRRWSQRKILVVVFSLLLVATASAGVWLMSPRTTPGLLPDTVAVSATFPLYQPQELPAGYYIDAQSVSATSQVVTFTLSSASGKAVVVTEQPRPSTEQMTTFYDGQMTAKKTFKTAAGEATAGQFEGSMLAGLSTDKTWILIRAVSAIDQNTMERIAHSFRPLSR